MSGRKDELWQWNLIDTLCRLKKWMDSFIQTALEPSQLSALWLQGHAEHHWISMRDIFTELGRTCVFIMKKCDTTPPVTFQYFILNVVTVLSLLRVTFIVRGKQHFNEASGQKCLSSTFWSWKQQTEAEMNAGTNIGIHEYQTGSRRVSALDRSADAGEISSWMLLR